jgi:hypothetical protein
MLEKRGIPIGCLNASPMFLYPDLVPVNPDFLDRNIPVSFFYGNNQIFNLIGHQDPGTVTVCLLDEIFLGFKDDTVIIFPGCQVGDAGQVMNLYDRWDSGFQRGLIF